MRPMTDAEAAALNDEVMGDYSICHGCATDAGGHSSHRVSATWIGTCIICGIPQSCCHVRDYGWPGGNRPRKEEFGSLDPTADSEAGAVTVPLGAS